MDVLKKSKNCIQKNLEEGNKSLKGQQRYPRYRCQTLISCPPLCFITEFQSAVPHPTPLIDFVLPKNMFISTVKWKWWEEKWVEWTVVVCEFIYLAGFHCSVNSVNQKLPCCFVAYYMFRAYASTSLCIFCSFTSRSRFRLSSFSHSRLTQIHELRSLREIQGH